MDCSANFDFKFKRNLGFESGDEVGSEIEEPVFKNLMQVYL